MNKLKTLISEDTSRDVAGVRHRQIVDSACDPIYRTSTDGHFTFVNRSAAALVKRSVEECVGLHFLELVREDYRDQAAQFYRQQMRDKVPVTYFEFPVAVKDASEVWIGQNVQLIIEGGKVVEQQGIARDITTRKQIEQQLLESEQRYRLLFEANPQPMWVYDVESLRFFAVNNAAVNHYGFSRQEFLAMTIKDIRPQEDVPALLESLSNVTDGLKEAGTWRHLKKDGTIIDVETTPHTLDFAGRPARIVLAVDVTERKRAETEILLQKARFQQLFENTPMGILRVDNRDVVLDANREFETMFQFSLSELRGCPINETIVPASHVDEAAELSSITFAGHISERETVRQRKDGCLVPVQIYGVPILAEQKRVGAFAIYIDLSERKQAEQALQEANKRAFTEYERLIERIAALGQTFGNARDLTMIYRALRDFAGASMPCDGLAVSLYEREKQTRRVVYCWTDNKELEIDDVIEMPVGEGSTGKAIKSGTVIIDNNFKPLVAVWLGEGAYKGIPRSALIAPMTVMGRTVGCVEVQSHQTNAYVQEHATAMRMATNLAANAVENVSLIQREQEKEEQLRQSQKMESIGTLAGGIAHDFNNLMTVVTGYSDLALMSLQGEDPLRSKIEEIKKAGERAADLTRQLLAFSRKQMLQPKVLDLNTVVTGMARMLPRVIGEHIDLRFRLGDSLGKIKADPGQIEQVLMNLAVNARDAMPECGVLTIKTENVHLAGKFGRGDLSIEPGHYVMMEVSDTGFGMDSETQSHIFEPFFTTKEVGKGTGLGLSTVYGIVKQSGGSLWAYSEVEKGTIFKIYLPRVDQVDEYDEVVPGSVAVPRGQETVLLVEDEDVVRNLSKETLETFGYHPTYSSTIGSTDVAKVGGKRTR